MNKFARLAQQAQEHESYWEEHVKLRFATLLLDAMEEASLSQRQFAKRANVSESQISQILAGTKNLSIKSMTKYAMALGQTVNISLQPKQTKSTASSTPESSDKWFKRIEESSQPNRRARGKFWDLSTADEDVFVYHAGNEARNPQVA